MSCLDSVLGYSTEEFQALQPIVLVVFNYVGAYAFTHVSNMLFTLFSSLK